VAVTKWIFYPTIPSCLWPPTLAGTLPALPTEACLMVHHGWPGVTLPALPPSTPSGDPTFIGHTCPHLHCPQLLCLPTHLHCPQRHT
jgi:hypothetical protein